MRNRRKRSKTTKVCGANARPRDPPYLAKRWVRDGHAPHNDRLRFDSDEVFLQTDVDIFVLTPVSL
jgi:hypothetical protein